MYFINHGRDWAGDDFPNDTLHHVPRKGLNFGYPYCHQGDTVDPDFGAGRSCSEFAPPLLKLGPHVAPIGTRFYTGACSPPSTGTSPSSPSRARGTGREERLQGHDGRPEARARPRSTRCSRTASIRVRQGARPADAHRVDARRVDAALRRLPWGDLPHHLPALIRSPGTGARRPPVSPRPPFGKRSRAASVRRACARADRRARGPGGAAAQADVEAGRSKAEPCAACHGRDGNATIPGTPSLAGQPAWFTHWALIKFRDGRRKDAAMSPFAQNLADADIAGLSAYYAAQSPRPRRGPSTRRRRRTASASPPSTTARPVTGPT